jgi:uncharacterized membrane protein
MQCPSCHNEVSPQASFCGFCGTQVGAAAPGYTPVGGGAAAVPVTTGASGLSENAAAAISYLTIIPAIIFLVQEPYNKMRLVRFHAIQSIALNVAWIVVWILIAILHVMIHFIPLIGVFFLLLDFLVPVGFLVGWLLAILKASKGEFFQLPFIGDFSAKQANL